MLSKVGRKTFLQGGTALASISLIAIAIGFGVKPHIANFGNFLIIIGLIIFMGNFGLTLGPLVWLYIAEIVEPQIIPFSTLSNWASASVVIITFPILSKAFGTPIPLFVFFAIWSAVSLVIGKKWLI